MKREKVYIVEKHEEGIPITVGICSTKEIAKEYIENHPLSEYEQYMEIEEFEIDDLVNKSGGYDISLDIKGNLHGKPEFLGFKREDYDSKCMNIGEPEIESDCGITVMTVCVEATSLKEAIQKADDIRKEYITSGKLKSEAMEEKIEEFLASEFSAEELEHIRDFANHYDIFGRACERKKQKNETKRAV